LVPNDTGSPKYLLKLQPEDRVNTRVPAPGPTSPQGKVPCCHMVYRRSGCGLPASRLQCFRVSRTRSECGLPARQVWCCYVASAHMGFPPQKGEPQCCHVVNLCMVGPAPLPMDCCSSFQGKQCQTLCVPMWRAGRGVLTLGDLSVFFAPARHRVVKIAHYCSEMIL
jgi:hypothetical protein